MSDKQASKSAKGCQNPLLPDPSFIRGKCPKCGGDLVSNLYYIGGRGYVLRYECWGSLVDPTTCDYKRTL